MDMKQRSSWGGARKGAGRKPSGLPKTTTIAIRVSEDIKHSLVEAASQRGITVSSLVQELLYERIDVCKGSSIKAV